MSKRAEQESVFANSFMSAENLACDSALHNNFTKSVVNSSKKQSQAFLSSAPF